MSAPTEFGHGRVPSETAFAVLTLLAAGLHALGEGYYHACWGQPFYALFPDIVAVTLLLTAGLRSLAVRPASAAGMLAAGWGFLACLAYRAVFERVAAVESRTIPANGEPTTILTILSLLAICCAAGFAWALRLAWRESARSQEC